MLETVLNFKYLGSIITHEGSKAEILLRVATATLTRLKLILKDKNITLQSKIKLMRSLAISIFLYACETWTLTVDLQRRVHVMEIRCCRNIFCISYKDHVTNKEVHNRIQRAIWPYEDLLTTVKRRKLKLYKHVSRTSGLIKTTMQCTVKGERKKKKTEEEVGGSESGQAWTSQRHKGRQTTGRGADSWLRGHRWCPNDTRAKGLMTMTNRQITDMHLNLNNAGAIQDHFVV